MITRIVMDVTVEAAGKTFVEGAVYDSRFPLDVETAADGIQHCIPQDVLDVFVAQGKAHEQSWDEWAADKPGFRETFRMVDVISTLPNPAMSGFNVRQALRESGEEV